MLIGLGLKPSQRIWAEYFFQRGAIGRNAGPFGDRHGRYFRMILGAERFFAKRQALDGTPGIRRQDGCAVRELLHFGGVPLEAFHRAGQTQQKRTRFTVRGFLDFIDANLRGSGRPDCAAERIRQQLVAETDPQKGHLPVYDGLADGRFLRLQPGILLLFPDIHGPAHYPQPVVVAQVRDGLAPVEFDRLPFNAVFPHEIPKYAGMFDVEMLKDE